MGPSLIVIAMFIGGNLFSLIIVIICNTQILNEVNPQFISTSFDPNATIDFDSMILKSVNKIISKYFKEPSIISKHVGDLPLGNTSYQSFVLNETYHPFTATSQSKYFLMFDNDKTHIRILQIGKNASMDNQYDSMRNYISFYTIPIDNFIINNKSDYVMSKSVIKHCWSSVIPGRIVGAVGSNDKNTIALVYRVIKGNIQTYRMRYITDLRCNEGIEEVFQRQDERVLSAFKEYLEESYSQINGVDNRMVNDEQFKNNFLENESYDDYPLNGNTPITAMAVQRNAIAYARDIDYHSFYIIKRTLNEKNKINWETSFKAISINRTLDYYYHTNSLRFITDNNTESIIPKHDFKIIQTYLTINNSSIYLKCDMIKANYSSNTYFVMNLLHNKIDENIIGQSNKEFNLPNIIRRLKKYTKVPVFSNSNTNNTIFEFSIGTVFYMNSDSQGRYILHTLTNTDNKVEKISSDNLNENIVIKYHKGDLMYQHHKHDPNQLDYSDKSKVISFKSLPKKFRSKTTLSYLIENFNERVVMIMLMDNGIMISLDFTKIVKKANTCFWRQVLNEHNYTIMVIIFANIVSFIIYMKIFRTRRLISQVTQRTSQDITQLIMDLNRRNALEHNMPINQEQTNNQQIQQPPNLQQQQQQPLYNSPVINNNNEEDPLIENIPPQ